MATGRRRIVVHKTPNRPGFLRRLFSRKRPELSAVQDALMPPLDTGVDYRLAHRAAVRAVREFTEQIDTYQLHSRRSVHVVSSYLLPGDRGLQERVPEWIAERIRFGILRGGGECEYIRIDRVDISWDDEGTTLLLHLAEKVAPGTRAFVAAYLGGPGLRPTGSPPGLVLGES